MNSYFHRCFTFNQMYKSPVSNDNNKTSSKLKVSFIFNNYRMDFGLCQKIAKYIMRPPRTTYQLQDLGPNKFQHRNRVYHRIDFTIQNERKNTLQCSLFKQKNNMNDKQTVVFLHANSSSRLAVKNYLGDLLPFFNVACMDCAGSGISGGNFVTLGYYEKQDLRSLIKYLKKQFCFSKFILWGRSMGAVTSLLYTAKYQDIEAVVSDNAFSDLEQTCRQLKDSYLSIFPNFLLETLLSSTQQYMDQNMNKVEKIDFKLNKLKPKQCVNKINCPIFYIYSENDKIVNNRHSKALYELSNYPKRIMSVKGDHNGHRDADIKGKVIDCLLDLVLTRKKENKNRLKHQFLELETKQQQQKIVFQSPLNKNLTQSYLGKKQCNKQSIYFQETQINKMKFSFKLDQNIDFNVSQTSIDDNKKIGPNIMSSELKQEHYQVETIQLSKTKSSCFGSCQPTRRRKKIFSNN